MHELSETISSDEFGQWQALYEMEPWGPERADLGFAIVASTVANYAGRMRPDSSGPAAPAEYMPFHHDNVSPAVHNESPIEFSNRLNNGAR